MLQMSSTSGPEVSGERSPLWIIDGYKSKLMVASIPINVLLEVWCGRVGNASAKRRRWATLRQEGNAVTDVRLVQKFNNVTARYGFVLKIYFYSLPLN